MIENFPVETAEAVIIGAGVSGLRAAKVLADSPEIQKIILLEARDRVGGRCWKDNGAGYVDSQQLKVNDLLSEFGLKTFSVYNSGAHFVVGQSEKQRRILFDIPTVSPCKLLALVKILAQLEVSADTIDVESPWETANAELWDSLSVRDYIKSQTKDEEIIGMVDVAFTPVFGSNISEYSLFYLLFLIKSCYRVSRLIQVENGAQEKKVEGGFGLLPEAMARQLKEKYEKVEISLGDKVVKIDYKSLKGVVITTSKGRTIQAKKCIVALQPTLYKTLGFSPPLPIEKQELAAGYAKVKRSYAKARISFKMPWWRKKGFSGQVASCDGPAAWIVDDVKLYIDDPDKKFALCFLIASPQNTAKWRSLGTKAQRERLLLDQLASHFDPSREYIEYNTAYEEYDWDVDEFSNGCVLALAPETMKSFKCVRDKVDDIHFAGTELATRWTGYVDGAIQSGERAANEVLWGIYPESKPKNKGLSDQLSQNKIANENSRPWIETVLYGRPITEKLLQEEPSEACKICTIM